MSVKIRLRRMGRNKQPFYRVVATDSRCSTSGRFLEKLGWYDPTRKEPNFSLKMDRVEYWKNNGAELSDTAKSLVRKARKGLSVEAAQLQPDPDPIPVAASEDAEVVSAVEPEMTTEEL